MNNYRYFVGAFLISTALNAQTYFDQFERLEGVNAMQVNKKMFQMLGSIYSTDDDKDSKKYLSVIENLDDLKVYSSSNPKFTSKFKSASEQHVRSAALKEYKIETTATSNLKIWSMPASNSGRLQELLVYKENIDNKGESILIALKGNFKLSDLSILIEKMNLPPDSALKKIKSSIITD